MYVPCAYYDVEVVHDRLSVCWLLLRLEIIYVVVHHTHSSLNTIPIIFLYLFSFYTFPRPSLQVLHR